jgi:hypothetical protein
MVVPFLPGSCFPHPHQRIVPSSALAGSYFPPSPSDSCLPFTCDVSSSYSGWCLPPHQSRTFPSARVMGVVPSLLLWSDLPRPRDRTFFCFGLKIAPSPAPSRIVTSSKPSELCLRLNPSGGAFLLKLSSHDLSFPLASSIPSLRLRILL